MFTPGLALAAGVPYTIEFSQHVDEGFGDPIVNLSVWAGIGQGDTSMTIPLWSEDNLGNETCVVRTAEFVVPTTDTYNIGFHCTTPGGGGELVLDDFKLTYMLWGTCGISPCNPCMDPGAPVITQITDSNPCARGGLNIVFTPGASALRHDLYMDGVIAHTDISSPVVFLPPDTSSHSFSVMAVWGMCHTESGAVEGTDEGSPRPGIPLPTASDWDACASDGIRITWGPVAEATSYDLQVDGTTVIAGVTSPHVYVPGNSASHSFRARAKSGNCAGIWSSASSAIDENLKPATPAAPSVADLTPCSLTGVQITWGAVSGATSYDIFVDEATILSGVSSPYTRLPGNSSSHSYRVRAWRSGCKGDWSSSTVGTDVNGMAAPSAPTVTDLDPCAQSGVSVSWTPVPGATAYDLVIGGIETVAGVTSPATYDPRDTANHDYSIQARAPGCTGDRSNPTTKGDQDKGVVVPSSFKATDLAPCAATGVSLTWNTVTGATGYELLVDGTTTIAGVTSPYTHLPGNTATHTYRVRAKNDSCTSGWSAVDSVADGNLGVPTPDAPGAGDLDPCALTGMSITWTAVANATAYDLRVDGATTFAGVTSPHTYVPGNTTSHTYEVRGRNPSCTGVWSAGVSKGDGDAPGAPTITSVEDIDAGQHTGIRVNYTAGLGATRHDLYRDGALVQSSYTSGATHTPGDAWVHTYTVRAWKFPCSTGSNAVQGFDGPQAVPPEIAPGDSVSTAQSWPDKTTHTWPSNANCTSGYLLYRGTPADLPKLMDSSKDSCLRFKGYAAGENTKSGMTEDPATEPGRFYWYLVTGVNGSGEGTAGAARSVDLRENCLTP